MLNFEQEIKKFHPSLEIDDTEKTVIAENSKEDLTDLMIQIMNEKK